MASIDKVLAESLEEKEQGIDEAFQWQAMPLHEAYHHQITKVSDLHHTFGWLNKCELAATTETLILAVQEQVLPTRQQRVQGD